MKKKQNQVKKKNKKVVTKKTNRVSQKSVPHKKIKRRKVRYGRVFLVLVCFFFVGYIGSKILDVPIRNIYINGNVYLTDQQIIEIAGIQDYPSIIRTSKLEMKKKLEENIHIQKATIKKKKLKEVYIQIEENTPLFYNQSTGCTVLSDLREIQEIWNAPVLLNYVPDTIYETFKIKMQEIDSDIIERVSEITYDPNHVDEERFLFTMRDGNYVYLTLETFESINNYVSIYAEFTSKYGNKKGILNLDSGQYFTIIE